VSLPPKLLTWLPVQVPKGTGVRDMRKVVDLLIGERDLAPGSTIDGKRRIVPTMRAAICSPRPGAE
jgi:hypothetical protein